MYTPGNVCLIDTLLCSPHRAGCAQGGVSADRAPVGAPGDEPAGRACAREEARALRHQGDRVQVSVEA